MSFELRPPTRDDIPALAEISARNSGSLTETRIRELLESPTSDPERNWRVLVEGGSIVGAGYLWRPETSEGRVFLRLNAYPRAAAVYERLLDWGEESARSEAAGAGVRLHGSALSDNDVLAEVLRGRGFELVRHFFTMEIDLDEEPAEPRWPEGLEVRTFEPGEERAVYDVDMEAFEDHWDFFPVPFDEWRDHFFSSSESDPTLWFLACEGDEIAGIALCSWEVRPVIGRVNVLAVRRPWRRRGLGRALLLHAFGELRRRGRRTVDLNVDAENLTGALRLYERAGMHVALRDDSYRKAL